MCPPCWSLLRLHHIPKLTPPCQRLGERPTRAEILTDGWLGGAPIGCQSSEITDNRWQLVSQSWSSSGLGLLRLFLTTNMQSIHTNANADCHKFQNKTKSGTATIQLKVWIFEPDLQVHFAEKSRNTLLWKRTRVRRGVSISNGSSPHYIREKD